MGDLNPVEIDYTNHRGERAWRRVIPRHLWFGSTEWHREPQWLLAVLDLGKDAPRDFALSGVHGFRRRPEPGRGVDGP